MRFCKNVFATLFAVTVLATSHSVRAANSIRFSDRHRRQLKDSKKCKGEDYYGFEFQGKVHKGSKQGESACYSASMRFLEDTNNDDFCCQQYWVDGKGDSCASGTVADVCCETCAEADCSCFDVANIVYKSSKGQKGIPYTCNMIKVEKIENGDPEVCCRTYNGRKVEDVCCAACATATYDCDCWDNPFQEKCDIVLETVFEIDVTLDAEVALPASAIDMAF